MQATLDYRPYTPKEKTNETNSIKKNVSQNEDKLDINLNLGRDIKIENLGLKSYKMVTMINIDSRTDEQKRTVSRMYSIPPFISESFILAQQQAKAGTEHAVKLGLYAFIANAVYLSFGLPFYLLIGGLFLLAIIDYLLPLMKRFKVDGIDYTPLAKAQLFLAVIIVFVACSLAQILVDITLWNTNGTSFEGLFATAPDWISFFPGLINIQTIGSLFLIGFYIQSIRRSFIQGATSTTPNYLSDRK